MADPFEALRSPIIPAAPDPQFAANLRARVVRALAQRKGIAMSTVSDAPPATYAGVVPYIHVRDARRAIAWYEEAFGARPRGVPYVGDDGSIGHAEIEIAGAVVMLSDSEYPGLRRPLPGEPVTFSLVITVSDVDVAAARAVAAGATLERAPQDNPYGRNAVVRDPFGERWMLQAAPTPAVAAGPTHGAGQSPRQDAGYREVLRSARRIVIMDWPSRDVPDTLVRAGYEVTVYGGPAPDDIFVDELRRPGEQPGNWGGGDIVSRRTGVPPEHADVVYDFRPFEEFGGIVDLARRFGARLVWHQSGVGPGGERDPLGCAISPEESVERRHIAETAGLSYVDDAYLPDVIRNLGLLSVPEPRRQGDVTYASLFVPDANRAAAFFGQVLGWSYGPDSSDDYHRIEGLSLPQDIMRRPGRATLYCCYEVDDAAAALEAVRGAGGRAGDLVEEYDGLTASCVDDQGTAFALYQSLGSRPPRRPAGGPKNGDLVYISLDVVDSVRTRAFYGTVLGWRFTEWPNDCWEARDVAPALDFTGGHESPGAVPTYQVGDIAAAIAAVRAGGGIAPEPVRTQHGLTQLGCIDDQGTRFGLNQP